MARKYQHAQQLLEQIKEMLAKGMTQKEVENTLGLTGYRPVHALLKRGRKKEAQNIPKKRGRKPFQTLQEKLRNTIFYPKCAAAEGDGKWDIIYIGKVNVCAYIVQMRNLIMHSV